MNLKRRVAEVDAGSDPSRGPKDAGSVPERYPDVQVSNPAPAATSEVWNEFPTCRLIYLMQCRLRAKTIFAYRGNDGQFYSPVFESKEEAEAWKEKHGTFQPVTVVLQ